MATKQELRQNILSYLYQQAPDDKIGLSELCEAIGKPPKDEEVLQTLDFLKDKGFIELTGIDREHSLCWITFLGRQQVFEARIEAKIEELQASQIKPLAECKFDVFSDEGFFEQLNYEEITSIDIVGHTGEHLIKAFFDQIRESYKLRETFKEIDIRILLRNPKSETDRRANKIRNTVIDIQDFQNNAFDKLHFHFYQNLPVFRAIICSRERREKTYNRIAFIGFYYFPIGSKSKRFSHAFIVDEKETGKHHFIEIVRSWFDRFWGKTKEEAKEIYAVILDFDDTVVNSHDIQINAWIETIQEAK
jgi:hypothetical protein